MTFGFFLLAMATAVFSLIAKRLAATPLTAPMVFIALGVVFSHANLLPADDAESVLDLVAEIALIVLLFLDAAQIDSAALRRDFGWPLRMLLIGLPLAILLALPVIMTVFPDWPIVAAALAAAILAPTDAALGQAVVTNPNLPETMRRTLTVESGLNDGLALPVVLLFAALLADQMGAQTVNWGLFIAEQLVLGPLAGIMVGAGGARLMLYARDHDLTADAFEGVGALALAGACYLLAVSIGGNGFIAAFIGGLAFGRVAKGRCRFVYEFAESEGNLLTWGAFFLLGFALVPDAVDHLDAPMLIVILMSLFMVRPLAIWLSLTGSSAPALMRGYFGWFGPRGLATALFALLIVGKIDHYYGEMILALAINTVWISALLHGLSAVPAATWYAGRRRAAARAPL